MPTAENRVAGTPSETGPPVAVLGGGLAGLAAAAGLVEAGVEVELFESRRRLGGRAGSFEDAMSGRWIDRCQHVAMACCTNLVDFCRRVGIDDGFDRHRTLHFFGPDGRRCDFAAVGWLPAPLHLAPALMRLAYLRPAERWRILWAMTRLARTPRGVQGADTDEPIGPWLRRHGQSEQAMARFWSVVLASALGETLEHASLSAARKVFVDGFLGSARAYELLIPRMPLAEIFDRRAGEWLVGHGVQIHRRTRVARIETDAENRNARAVVLADGTRREFDFVVAAVPWHRLVRLFDQETLAVLPEVRRAAGLRPAPITAVHLWFDRPMLDVPHGVLVDRLGQWVFQSDAGYCQVVVSASHGIHPRDREDVIDRVCRELRAIRPAARDAKLLHSRMVIEPAAVFSARPGTDRLRPGPTTRIGNLMLSGDWTATGWPATMEGAVRSGYLAAEAILRRLGRGRRLVVADLPRGRLSRWLFGGQ